MGSKINNNVANAILSVNQNAKFVQKQTPDFYVTKSLDSEYQTKKYNNIQGKNIFTNQYIQ